MKIRTTAVILAAVVLSLAACKKQNETNVNEEATPAATPAPAPAAMPPESAATTPAAVPPESAATMSPGMTTPGDTMSAKQMQKKGEKLEKKGEKMKK